MAEKTNTFGEKFRIFINEIVRSKSLHFIFYSILYSIKSRLPFEPDFLKDIHLKRVIHFMPLEEHLYPFMVPKHSGCFVDVGAHVGEWTCYMAKKGHIVHAFEPFLDSIKKICINVKSYPRVQVYPFALGKQHNLTSLELNIDSAMNKIANETGDMTNLQTNIEVRTLDSFEIENVGLIKIDTEGYELPVLLGARKTIQKDKPRLIIEVHKPFREQIMKIGALLKNYGYSYTMRHKSGGQPHIIADGKEEG